MSKKLTPIQLEMLKALREHKVKRIKGTFSMDEFYYKFYSDIEKEEFREYYYELRRGDYIRPEVEAEGSYEITEEGLRHLDDIGE